MKALIFNSGLGSRMGSITNGKPKSMVTLANGETVYHRQLRILFDCGIRSFVVTTGPFADMLEESAAEFINKGCAFKFVHNPDYERTNYIYSMWLAREELAEDDILLLHGDLVFDDSYVAEMLSLPAGSYGSVNSELPLPQKDFKARIVNGEVREVGVDIWGENCHAFQAMYRLSPKAMRIWLDQVNSFVDRGQAGVYAENAANEVFNQMHVMAHQYTGHILEEVDTPEDLKRVSLMIRDSDFSRQPVFELFNKDLTLIEGSLSNNIVLHSTVPSLLSRFMIHHPLVVADKFLQFDEIAVLLGTNCFSVFSGYTSNPTYEEVLEGLKAFRSFGCDSVVSVGGGSAIDVAKCIKIWSSYSLSGDRGFSTVDAVLSDYPLQYSSVPHLAIPTTAGTGSESTHFAVIYLNGTKQSISHDCLQPNVALLAPQLLSSLPTYQRGATLLDAFCQAVESYWSVASNDRSRAYSRRAIPLIVNSVKKYMSGNEEASRKMMRASNLAGKAINITTTTLAHAMSYKITSLYGIAHGHAVALCMRYAWRALLSRGGKTTQQRLHELDAILTGHSQAVEGSGLAVFEELYNGLRMPVPSFDERDLDELVESVDPQRLQNYPLHLTRNDLQEAYRFTFSLDNQ